MYSNYLFNSENDFEIGEGVIEEIIKSCDKNGDGQIDFK